MTATRTIPDAPAQIGPNGHTGLNRQVLLQLKAPRTIRRHLIRSLLRVIVLLAADGATFVAVRGVVRAVRDSALLGPAYAALVEGVIPKRYLGGWQFGAALLIGLSIAGTYGRGDERRNTGRMLLGVVLAVSLSLWDSLWTLGMGPVALQFL